MHLYLNAFEGPGSTFNTEMRNNRFGFRSEVKVDEGGFGYSRLTRVEQNGAKVPCPSSSPRRPAATSFATRPTATASPFLSQ